MPSVTELMQLRIPLWKAAVGVVIAIIIQQTFNKTESKAIAQADIKEEPSTDEKVVAPQTNEVQAKVDDDSNKSNEDEDDSDDDSYDDPYDADNLFYDEPYTIRDVYDRSQRPFKMLLCVNMELKMGHGKIAAQCGHATMGAYQLSRKYCKSGLKAWEQTGVAKIALKVPKESDMYELYEKVKAAGLVGFIVQDAGHTQIPAGSRTVLAVGPAPAQVLDPIFSHLKLL